MIDAVPEKRIVKINATVDDDINLILDAITKVDAAFVLLVLPEGNDLANSPIGLKALRKKTLEKGKRMVLVVPQGISYELAKKAGFIAATSQETVTGDVWQTVMQQYEEHVHENAGMPSQKKLPNHMDKKVEYMNPAAAKLPVPEIVTGGGKVVNDEPKKDEVKTEEKRNDDHVQPPSKQNEEKKEPVEKSEKEKLAAQSVTGMDFSRLVGQNKKTPFFGKPKPAPMTSNTIVPPQEINSFHPDVMPKKVGAAIAKVGKKREVSPFVKFMLFGVAAGLLAVVGMFIAYYLYFPRVRIEFQVQSTPVTLSDQVLATSAVTGFDVNLKEIQATKEKIEKNGTLSFKATGAGSDGTKATGTVVVQNTNLSSSETVPVGTLLTSGSLKFAVSGGSSIVIPPASSRPVPVTATDFGENYNLASGNVFTVTGFSTLQGTNSEAFTGGTKRDFTVVSQKDVDTATKSLQDELGKQGAADLAYMNLDKGYEYLKESVKTEVKGKPTVTPAVGAEVSATDENPPSISMVTNTTALYYHSESLSKLAEQLLIEKYRIAKNLSAEGVAQTSIENLSVKIDKVTIAKDDKITLNFTATGLATTRLDTEKIRNDVAGKKWPEMLDYISAQPSLARAPEVKFSPSWLPEFARYVPKEVSRIDVGITVVSPEVPVAQ